MLDGALQGFVTSSGATTALGRSRWRGLLTVAASVMVATLAGGVAVWRFRPASIAEPERFAEILAEGLAFRNTGRRVVAISPDGRRFLFNATGGLFIREMNESAAHPIPGTELELVDPTFSPDGRSIAFWQSGLRRIAITGGQPVPICPATATFGLSWNRDGTIVYAQADGIWRVSETGGTPTRIVEPEAGEVLSLPQVLPGGQWVLMTSTMAEGPSQVVARSLGSTQRKVVVGGAVQGLYFEPGYLLYLSSAGGLMATAFDHRTMEKRGGAVSLLKTIGTATTTGEVQLSLSDNGSLIYLPSNVEPGKLVWVDRSGTRVGDVGADGLGVQHPSLSPDERFVVYSAYRDAK